ncbi:hypothetical protein PENSPDRAFT_657239 [Peniophora sp. CONT]|nr:hypothetical protein PENSPDRAFT_657239 [Peniophora sp. CONT]
MEPSSREYWIKAKDTRVLQLRLPSDLATPLPRETINPLYDKEIAALTNILAFFKAAKNAQLPIYTLPDDVLLDIFLYADRCLMPPPAPQAGYRISPPRVSMAMVCSQVCLRWRILALGSEILWAIVDFASSGPAWVAERLARSGLADLVVRVVPSSEMLLLQDVHRFTAFVSSIVPEHQHIASLELCIDTPLVTEFVERLPSSGGALAGIRRLSIHPVRRSTTALSDESDLLSVIASCLSSPMPYLREASLSGAVALASSSRLWDALPSNLTSLRLEQDRKTANFFKRGYPGFPDLLSFLQHSTGLQSLVLRWVPAIPTEHRPVVPKPFPLPHLRHLEIAETPRLCDYLLKTMQYSDQCRVLVETEGGESNRYAPLLPAVAVARHKSSLSLEVASRVAPGIGTLRHVRVRLSSLLQTNGSPGDDVPSQDWKFNWRNGHGGPFNLVRSLLDVHPLMNIHHLSLRGAMPLSVPEWITRLSKSSVIENMVIHTSDEYTICVALGCPIAVSSDDQTPTSVLLPSLARLELCACDLGRLFRATAAECGAADENQPLRWYLLRTMRARVGAGAVPRQFVLTNCDRVKESWVDEIKAAVPEEMRREWDFDAWLGKARAL